MRALTGMLGVLSAVLLTWTICLKVSLDEVQEQAEVSHYAVTVLSHDVDVKAATAEENMDLAQWAYQKYAVEFERHEAVSKAYEACRQGYARMQRERRLQDEAERRSDEAVRANLSYR